KDRLFIHAGYAWNLERFADSADAEKTVRLYTEITEKFPDEKMAFMRLGILYRGVNRQDYHTTIEMFHKVIELDPLEAGAYNYLAYTYNTIGNTEKSLWAINKYVELAPNEANPYDTRGDLYSMNGNLDAAIANYQKAFEIDPEFVASLRKLAYTKLFAGDISGAKELMQDRVTHSVRDVRLGGLGGLKNIALYQGKLVEAKTLMHHYLDSKQMEQYRGVRHWSLGSELGEFFIDLWSLTQDDQWIDSAIAIKSVVEKEFSADTTRNKVWPFYKYIKYKFLAEGIATAEANLKESQEKIDTTIGWMVFFYQRDKLSLSYLNREYDSAAFYANQIIKNSPRFVWHVQAGRALLLSGRISEAVTALEKAAMRHDDSRIFSEEHVVSVYYWLGRAYEASGWDDRAITQYEKVTNIYKDADPGIVHNEDAKIRLAKLKE
ncbi:tetratricopeptide repeat protein, partial [bacterium AH-315-F03]|nr:tetratricopeptide repeat protein [bacterium AH-315-F03]